MEFFLFHRKGKKKSEHPLEESRKLQLVFALFRCIKVGVFSLQKSDQIFHASLAEMPLHKCALGGSQIQLEMKVRNLVSCISKKFSILHQYLILMPHQIQVERITMYSSQIQQISIFACIQMQKSSNEFLLWHDSSNRTIEAENLSSLCSSKI